MKPRTFTTRKFDGDSAYSWAVFDKASLKGLRPGIVFYGDARPVMTGLGQAEARRVAARLTAEAKAVSDQTREVRAMRRQA